MNISWIEVEWVIHDLLVHFIFWVLTIKSFYYLIGIGLTRIFLNVSG